MPRQSKRQERRQKRREAGLRKKNPQKLAEEKFREAGRLMKQGKPEEAYRMYKALGLMIDASKAKSAVREKIAKVLEKHNFGAARDLYYYIGDMEKSRLAHSMMEQHQRAALAIAEDAYEMVKDGVRELAQLGIAAEEVDAARREDFGRKAQYAEPDPLGPAAKSAAAGLLETAASTFPQHTQKQKKIVEELNGLAARLRAKPTPPKPK